MRGSNEKKNSRARRLRRDSTLFEKRLWSALSNRKVEGHKFVRQFPVGPFFGDFACREAKLIIELDGSQHANSPTDPSRTAYLESRGYRVLRFWNGEIAENIDGVVETILDVLRQLKSDGTAPHLPAASGGPLPLPAKAGRGG